MPEAIVQIGLSPTLITQVAGTPVAVTGRITVQEQSGQRIRYGRGSATQAPTVWFVARPAEGPLGRTLDEIAPGGSGDHLWGQGLRKSVSVAASWS